MTDARKLTVAEVELCRSVFGNAIDYSLVKIFNRKWWPFQPRKVTMAPDGNLWFHPDSDLFCGDYCGANLSLQALFIHEMTHVWQHQQGIFLPLARHPFCRYDYQLIPGKKFSAYGIEQQAEIVSHKFLLSQGRVLKNGYVASQYEGLLPFGAQPFRSA